MSKELRPVRSCQSFSENTYLFLASSLKVLCLKCFNTDTILLRSSLVLTGRIRMSLVVVANVAVAVVVVVVDVVASAAAVIVDA